jgi:hypothetical protein
MRAPHAEMRSPLEPWSLFGRSILLLLDTICGFT